MFNHRRNGNDLFSGLLIGGVIGATISLFYAPQTGKRLRKELRKKSRNLRREADAKFATAQKEVEDLLHETKKRTEQLKTNIEKTAEVLAVKAGSLIE